MIIIYGLDTRVAQGGTPHRSGAKSSVGWADG